MDDAVRRYVAHYLAGRDVLLMIRDRDRCREASRRIRDDLIHLGIVAAGPGGPSWPTGPGRRSAT